MALTKEDLISILDKKLEPLLGEVSGLKQELREMKGFLDFANTRYEEISNKMVTIEDERVKYVQENQLLKKTIEKLDDKVRQLETQSNDVRQYTRRDCVEIHGIPPTRDEDTNSIVREIGDLMEVYLDEKDISISHRLPLGKKYKGKLSTPAIIVKFVRRDIKDKFYKARKQLKECTTTDLGHEVSNRIFINESLTEENRRVFNECLKFKKEQQFTFIWTSNGKTYIRKNKDSNAIIINCKEDLLKIKASHRP